MLPDRSRILAGPLERVTVSHRVTSPRPAGVMTDAVRADQLGTCVCLALDDPSALRHLQDAAAELRDAPHLAAVLVRVMRTAMDLVGADFGNVQVVDPRDGSLVLVTQCGFGPRFLDHFAVVDDDHCVCGRAARRGAQEVVADVRAAPGMARHDGVFRAAGVRAVQSTPLLDCAGRLVGMVSTHMSEPGQPSERDLGIMRLYGLLAGESVGRRLRGPHVDGVPPGPRDEVTPVARCDPGRASADPLMSRILSDAINRIFSAGLSLAGALPRVTDDFAAQHVRACIEELDGMIHSMQRAAVDLGVRGEHRESPTRQSAGRLHRPCDETGAPARRA